MRQENEKDFLLGLGSKLFIDRWKIVCWVRHWDDVAKVPYLAPVPYPDTKSKFACGSCL